MNTVIAFLNAVVEGRMPTALKPEPCRRALFAIETQTLAVEAIRLFVTHKGDPEAFAHAQRFLDLHDKQMADRAPRPAPVDAFDDLV